MSNELNKTSKSEKSKPTKSELGFQTIDIPIKLHSELKALSGIKKIIGQNHFIYELATEAVQEYILKHKDLIPSKLLLENKHV
jgi:translation elongation factor EF-Tu-like GTPase